MNILLIIILFLQPLVSLSFNSVGWWVGEPNDSFHIENLNWDAYTHIRFGEPVSHSI